MQKVNLRVVNWNVNSVNARLSLLVKLIEELSPDILLLQEIKCIKERFPYSAFDEAYNIAICGQKSYNGVAILSKWPIEVLFDALPNLKGDIASEARYIEALTYINYIPIHIACVYVPNGRDINSIHFDYKIHFLECLLNHITNKNSIENNNLIIGGDFNVAPEILDVYSESALYNKIGFHTKERNMMRSLFNKGLLDAFRIANQDACGFTWWDYRGRAFEQDRGMRIDHILISPFISRYLINCFIYKEARSWNTTSDHAPIVCDFTIPAN